MGKILSRLLQISGFVADRDARGAMARLARNEDGAWLVVTSVIMPVLIGVAGLGTEGGYLLYHHRNLQSAADAASYSAAIAYSVGTSADITPQARSVIAAYGYTLGAGVD